MRKGMNEHDATEIAFKNGYEKAIKEFAERLCEVAGMDGAYGYVDVNDITDLAKEMTEEKK